MKQTDWDDPNAGMLVAELRTAAGSPSYVHRQRALLVILNRGDAVDITVPSLPIGEHWVRSFDTGAADATKPISGTLIKANSVVVFSKERIKTDV